VRTRAQASRSDIARWREPANAGWAGRTDRSDLIYASPDEDANRKESWWQHWAGRRGYGRGQADDLDPSGQDRTRLR